MLLYLLQLIRSCTKAGLFINVASVWRVVSSSSQCKPVGYSQILHVLSYFQRRFRFCTINGCMGPTIRDFSFQGYASVGIPNLFLHYAQKFLKSTLTAPLLSTSFTGAHNRCIFLYTNFAMPFFSPP